MPLTLIPKVKASVGNPKMAGSSLGTGVNAPLCQNLWVLHIANSLEQCSYVEERKKAPWFGLLANEMWDVESASGLVCGHVVPPPPSAV